MQTLIAERLRPLRDTLGTKAPAIRPVVSITAPLIGDAKYAVGEARAATLRWLQSRVGTLPAEAWKGSDFEHMAPGRFAAAVSVDLPNGSYWSLRCDDPDKEVPGRTWTTEVSIAMQGLIATFGVRLVVSVVEGMPSYVPSIPSFVRGIVQNPGLMGNARPLTLDPMLVTTEDRLDKFIDLLVDHRRRNPVFAIALGEDENDIGSAIVDARSLARRCLGIAHVAVISGDQAFELTRQVGRTLSVFRKAVRTYRPEFTFDDDPFRHPLALATQIESWRGIGREAFEEMLIETAAANSIRSHDNPDEFPPFTKVKQVALQTRRSAGTSDLDFPALLALAEQEIQEKQRDIEALESLLTESDTSKSEQSGRLLELESANAFLRSRVAQLELQPATVQMEADKRLPDTLDLLPEWAERILAGRVTLAPRAQRELKGAAFNDVTLLCSCLLYLGNEFWHMKVDGGGELVSRNEEKLAVLGVRNEPSGAEHLLKERGDTFMLSWGPQNRRRLLNFHLKNGGNTRDPTRCLRIYYFWDDDAQQVVIGSLPAHLDTRAS